MKNCPVCKRTQLSKVLLESNLPAFACPQCQGEWISAEDYWAWLEHQEKFPPYELSFYLDQCSRCQSLWFDKNEWVSLKQRGLHGEVHKVFSASWQANLHTTERQKKVNQVYVDTLGAQDYAEAKRIKQWIDQHPHRDVLLSFLNTYSGTKS